MKERISCFLESQMLVLYKVYNWVYGLNDEIEKGGEKGKNDI